MIEQADNLTKAQKEELFKRIQQLHKNLIDKRIILVDGIINNPIGKQIEEVIDILEKTGDTADMYINSPGGSTQAFLSIINKIKSSKLKIKTICLEQAGSGAMLLLAPQRLQGSEPRTFAGGCPGGGEALPGVRLPRL